MYIYVCVCVCVCLLCVCVVCSPTPWEYVDALKLRWSLSNHPPSRSVSSFLNRQSMDWCSIGRDSCHLFRSFPLTPFLHSTFSSLVSSSLPIKPIRPLVNRRRRVMAEEENKAEEMTRERIMAHKNRNHTGTTQTQQITTQHTQINGTKPKQTEDDEEVLRPEHHHKKHISNTTTTDTSDIDGINIRSDSLMKHNCESPIPLSSTLTLSLWGYPHIDPHRYHCSPLFFVFDSGSMRSSVFSYVVCRISYAACRILEFWSFVFLFGDVDFPLYFCPRFSRRPSLAVRTGFVSSCELHWIHRRSNFFYSNGGKCVWLFLFSQIATRENFHRQKNKITNDRNDTKNRKQNRKTNRKRHKIKPTCTDRQFDAKT